MFRIGGNLRTSEICKKHLGFSLLEILITFVLSLFLFETVLQNYLGAKKIYRVQDELASLNENVRFADFILWRNIMHAGFAGCRKISELDLHNHTFIDFKAFNAIRGYASDKAVPSYLFGKVVFGTDVIVISKADASVTKIIGDVDFGANKIIVEQNPATKGNLLLLIADCQHADLFVAENYRGNTVYVKGNLVNGYAAKNTTVSRFEELTFFVSNTGRLDSKNKPIYALYSSVNRHGKHELVSGVSNMQIYYGMDLGGHGVVSEYWRASQVDSFNLWESVLSVIIELEMQSYMSLAKKRKIYIKLRERG